MLRHRKELYLHFIRLKFYEIMRKNLTIKAGTEYKEITHKKI